MKTKDAYYIQVWYEHNPTIVGTGECAPIWGLSPEKKGELEEKLKEVCSRPEYFMANISLLLDYPSVIFGLETAFLDLNNGGDKIIFDGSFRQGEKALPINGLIWMSNFDDMSRQIDEKLEAGFDCIKIKVGAIEFQKELDLLAQVRNKFSSKEVILRVDANGAFTDQDVYSKLDALSEFDLHSIEQPVKAGQTDLISELCLKSPVPIALDEELISIKSIEEKTNLLESIRPQYLVLKPSLLGGFKSCQEWINLADERGIAWWITSMLESDIGLNAISQWTEHVNAPGHQGLGTGSLFTNNIPSPLHVKDGFINYDVESAWGSID